MGTDAQVLGDVVVVGDPTGAAVLTPGHDLDRYPVPQAVLHTQVCGDVDRARLLHPLGARPRGTTPRETQVDGTVVGGQHTPRRQVGIHHIAHRDAAVVDILTDRVVVGNSDVALEIVRQAVGVAVALLGVDEPQVDLRSGATLVVRTPYRVFVEVRPRCGRGPGRCRGRLRHSRGRSLRRGRGGLLTSGRRGLFRH